MKIKIKKPKIKVSAPKAITKAISSVTKPMETLAKTATSGDLLKATLKGDLKGMGAASLKGVQGIKDAVKQMQSGQLSNLTGAVGSVGSAIGSKELKKAAKNVEREGGKGINKYGDAAMDIGANVATGGTYGLAKTAAQSLASGGLKGLLSGKGLQQAALSAAGSYAGIDPNMLQAAQVGLKATQGDLKGAALQGLGSYAGLDPSQLSMAKTGLAAATGDKAGLASGLASEFGAGDNVSKMLGQFAGGNKQGLAAGLASQFGAGEDVSQLAGAVASGKSPQDIAMQQALKTGRGVASGIAKKTLGGPEFEEMKKLQNQFKNKNVKTLSGAIKGGIGADLYSKTRRSITDKYLKDASGKTIMGKNNAPILNPEYNQEEADRTQADIASAYEEDSGETEPGMLEKVGDFFGGAKDKISKTFGGAKKFAAKNKGLLGNVAQAGAAGLGYMASKDAMEEQQKLLKQQLGQEQAIGGELMGQKYDPNRYSQEQEFLAERIRGQGRTALTRQMEQESIQKSARTAAAGRLAGLEQQARLGGAALGTAGLAASLAGAQSGQNVMAEDMRARDVQAQQDLERAIGRTGQLSTQKTQEEAQLAQQKSAVEANRAQYAGATRSQLAQVAGNKANALRTLYSSGADLAKEALKDIEIPKEEKATVEQIQQPEPPRQSISTPRRDAARTMSNPKFPPPKKASPQPFKDKFNQQNMPKPGAGQGYGVLAPVISAAENAQGKVDESKKKVDQFMKNPFGFKL